MQMGRLLAFDKSIFRTCNNSDRHLQQPVLFLESVIEDRYRTVLISKLKEKRAELPRKTVAAAPSADHRYGRRR